MYLDSTRYNKPTFPFTRVGSQVQSLSRPPFFPLFSRGLMAEVLNRTISKIQNKTRIYVAFRRLFVQIPYSGKPTGLLQHFPIRAGVTPPRLRRAA